jgi:hypothetical protein
MKAFKRVLAVFLCSLIAFIPAVGAAGEFAPETATASDASPSDALTSDATSDEVTVTGYTSEPDKAAPELDLSDSQIWVSVGSKIKMKAEAKNFDTPPSQITWSSANPGIATVDSSGTVTGVSTGKAAITAVAMNRETEVSSSIVITVNSKRSLAHLLMSIGYSYTNLGDYFYSDNNRAWQMPFGFIRLYDTASQLIGYQYDFTRVLFTYDNKDWLIEFWKGQYAPFQYGGEIGVYTKYSTGFGDTPVSAYRCATDNRLNMEMTLYHQRPDGTLYPEFTREYGKYWWCDGYRIGRLDKIKPAKELRMVSRITLKDEKMALAFTEGMLEGGFTQVDSRDKLTLDTFYSDGCDVYFIWQNLTESQHLIPVMFSGFNIDALTSFFGRLRPSGRVSGGLNDDLNAD